MARNGNDNPNPKPTDPNGPQSVPAEPDDRPSIPAELRKHLKEQGYKLTKNDKGVWRVRTPGYGYMGDQNDKLKLLQHLYNKFGILNDAFDPTRAAYFKGNMYELNAGSGLNNGGSANVLTDAELAKVRERSGWTWESAYDEAVRKLPAWEREAGLYKDLETWQTGMEAARVNYLNNPGPTGIDTHEEAAAAIAENAQPEPQPNAPQGVGSMVYQPLFSSSDIEADYI